MKKTIGIIIVILAIGGVILFSRGELDLGRADGFSAFDCSVQNSSSVAIGDDISSTLFSGHSRTAYAEISVVGSAGQDFYLSFDEGASAVVGEGVHLSATTTPKVVFGLNTDFPYTGAVTGISSSATTTLSLTVCRYNR